MQAPHYARLKEVLMHVTHMFTHPRAGKNTKHLLKRATSSEIVDPITRDGIDLRHRASSTLTPTTPRYHDATATTALQY